MRAAMHEAPPQVCCGAALPERDDDIEEVSFDDGDFYEGIDLLETTRKQLKKVIRYGEIGGARKRILTNLCDDIKQFIDQFLDYPDDTDEEAKP